MERVVNRTNAWLRLVADHDRAQPWVQRVTSGYSMALVFMLLLAGLLVSG